MVNKCVVFTIKTVVNLFSDNNRLCKINRNIIANI